MYFLFYFLFLCVCSEHNHSVKDKETYQDWVKTMEPIYNNIHDITRVSSYSMNVRVCYIRYNLCDLPFFFLQRQCVMSDSQVKSQVIHLKLMILCILCGFTLSC